MSEEFLILGRIERDIINVHRSSCKVPAINSLILMKLEFSIQILEKYSNIKFNKNPFSGSRVVPCGRADRDEEAATVSNFADALKYVYPKVGFGLCLKKHSTSRHLKFSKDTRWWFKLLGCHAVTTGTQLSTFRRTVLRSYPGSVFWTEDDGITISANVCKRLPTNTA